MKRQLNTETPANLGIPAKDLGIKKTFDENIFKQTLMANKSNAAWLTLLETQQVQEQRVPELTSVSFMFNDSVDLKTTTVQEKFQEIFHNQNVSEHDSAEIEKLTRGQNKNKQWFEARSQRITASNFGCVVKLKDSTKPDNFIKDVMGYRTFDNKYCAWGRSHEPAGFTQTPGNQPGFNSVD